MAEQNDSGITIQDIALIAQIMDLATSRGAFRGTELSQVGAVFDKVNALLTRHAEKEKAAKEAAGAAQPQSAEAQ
jgi:hypothetical protein